MTREEAIDELQWGYPKEDTSIEECLRYKQAVDMAISALSTEGEYIKKEDILACQTTFTDEAGYEYKVIEVEEVEELPTYSFPDSAENKEEWIPVSESLPEDDTDVVYCTEMGTVGSCHYYEGFNHYKGCSRKDIFDDIVAWLPIPKPYKAESED